MVESHIYIYTDAKFTVKIGLIAPVHIAITVSAGRQINSQ